MGATLGDDWKNFFDLCIVDARKPLFFKGKSPFYKVDPKNTDSLIGDEITQLA